MISICRRRGESLGGRRALTLNVSATGSATTWRGRHTLQGRAVDADPDVRFLDAEELHTLLAVVPDDDLGRVQGVMYLAAAMTGMRQGELPALRWLDVDWLAQRVRVAATSCGASSAYPRASGPHVASRLPMCSPRP